MGYTLLPIAERAQQAEATLATHGSDDGAPLGSV
jgi:hypothetical protein